MTVKVYLLRHGEPADTKMFYGHHDVELSDRGREQIEAQVRWLRDESIAAVHTSDLARARIGAEALAQACDAPLLVDPAFREMHLGCLEGVSHRDARSRHPELLGRGYGDMLDFRMDGGGESVRDLAERVVPAANAAVGRLLAAHVTEGSVPPLAIYAHNTVVRVLLSTAAGCGPDAYIRFACRYGSISRVDLPTAGAQANPWAQATIAFANLDPSAKSRLKGVRGPNGGVQGPRGPGSRNN